MLDALQKAKYSEGTNFFCYLGPLTESRKLSQGAITQVSGVINLFIGPEGDFSLKEIEWMLLNEFNPIQLTNTRLRTETAALAVAATWMCLA
jgi:RsmE family RNA methyltransferase